MLCLWRGVPNGPQDMEERKDLLEGKKASSLDLSEWKEERSQVGERFEEALRWFIGPSSPLRLELGCLFPVRLMWLLAL